MHVDEGILWSPTASKTDHQPSSCYVQLTRVVLCPPLFKGKFPLQLQQHTHSHMRPLQPQGANKRAVRLEGYPSAPQGWRYRWCAYQEHVARPSIRLVALCTALHGEGILMSRFGICKHMSILFAGAVVGGQLVWFGGYVFMCRLWGSTLYPQHSRSCCQLLQYKVAEIAAVC